MGTLAYRSTNADTSSVFVLIITLLTAMSIPVLGVELVAALCVLPWFILFFYHYPLFLILLWPVALLLDTLFPYNPLRLRGFVLLPMDPVYFFTMVHLAVNAAVRYKKVVGVLRENPFLSLFLIVVGVYIVLYMPLYGKSAIGEARKYYFDFLFPLLVLVSVKDIKDLHWLLYAVFFVSICFATVGFLRLLTGQWIEHIVNAQGSLVLLFAAFSIVILRINNIVVTNRIVDVAMLTVFLSIVVMTQHRSVWLAGAFGLIFLFGFYRRQVVFLARTSMALIFAVTVVLTVFLVSPKIESSFVESASGIIDPYSDKNASWRIRGWQAQLASVKANLLFGEGLGGYYSWSSEGTEATTSPHNAYFQIALKFGLFGLIIYSLLACQFFYRALHKRRELQPGFMRACVEMGVLNFGAAHAFMIAYGFSGIMLIFLAVAMSAAELWRRSERSSRDFPARRFWLKACSFV